MSWLEWRPEVGLFSAMAAIELMNVAVKTLYKAASLRGLSYFVFIAYTYVIGTLVLLPLPFIFPRRGLPPFKLSFLYKIGLLALIGVLFDACTLKGVEYSSPALSSITENILPALPFIVAAIFRMENPNTREKTMQMKILGTIFSMSGAVIAIVYKGPVILAPPPDSTSLSSKTDWLLGGFILVSGSIGSSFRYTIQAHVVNAYPDERTITAIYFVFKTLIALPICIFEDPKLSHWALRPNIALIAILSSGLFSSTFFSFITQWEMHLKGPLYPAIFKPFSIAVAALFGVIFIGDALFLGSVIGAVIVLLGLYAVLLGNGQEEASEFDSPQSTDTVVAELDGEDSKIGSARCDFSSRNVLPKGLIFQVRLRTAPLKAQFR